MRKVAEVS